MRESRLPLTGWAGLLTSLSVLTTAAATAAALIALGRVGPAELDAVAVGAGAGLVAVALAVLGTSRHAAALRALRAEAVQRLQQPWAPVSPDRRRTSVPVSREVAELSAVLEALHLRVRLGDHVGERHRQDAETGAAGVFELLSGLVAAEEGARGQLAAELHDTVAQSLMTARSLLSQVGGPLDLARITDHVEDAEEQLRAVMARTRPPALREGDLAQAVRSLRLDMQSRYALDVEVSWPQPHPLPLASAITVYRFFQEGLLNVVKHADVDEARLELHVEPDVVVARVLDRGPGFDPEAVRPVRGRHVGLGLLRERARLSGGSLDVSSGAEGGVTLTLWLPRPASGVPRARREHGDDAPLPTPLRDLPAAS